MNQMNLSNDQKRRLSYQRQNAVRKAWIAELHNVENGKGTRDWTVEEQKELMERKCVSGYNGHHMKSVSLYPEYAGNEKNIQFLTEDEHFYGAHCENFRNPTNGYYNYEKGIMENFEGDSLKEVPLKALSENYCEKKDNCEVVQEESKSKNNSYKNSIYMRGIS